MVYSKLHAQYKLSVVGAGPGDPELITLKAARLLREADVILYDALANTSLLAHANPMCEKIFVGKRGHVPSISQDSINFLILEKIIEKGHVVRLKGGDPFIFGRGNEEINFVRQQGIETEYVPGISSIQSVGLCDIPLTARGYSEGFWVLTGHKSDGELASDLALACRSSSTVVLLMAMKKLAQIEHIYNLAGKGNTPVLIAQSVSTHKQKFVTGSVHELVKLAAENDLQNPAILLLGEVVHAIQKQPASLSLILHDLYS